MIDSLIEDLKIDEGWRSSVYRDSLGYWTIGYGFLVDKEKGGELPKHIGEDWLRYAAVIRWNALLSREPWLLDQPEDVQRALSNMSYQLGVNGVLNFTKMLAALKQNDRITAAKEALDSVWATQTPERAERVSSLIKG